MGHKIFKHISYQCPYQKYARMGWMGLDDELAMTLAKNIAKQDTTTLEKDTTNSCVLVA